MASGSWKRQLDEFLIDFKVKDIASLKKQVEEKVDFWKNTTLRLGVTGSSGSGKSSFINALRGLTAEDEGSADVDVTETTMNATPFKHPKNERFLIYDLPGVGTKTFPRESYLTNENVGFEKYDVFVIISCTRFTDEDRWLAEEIKKSGKSFIFVRTKVAEDISNQKKAKPNHFRKEPNAAANIVHNIREDCAKHLEADMTKEIFLIDNYDTDNPLLDFDKMLLKLPESIEEGKKDAFILSISCKSVDLVEEKKIALMIRTIATSLISALGTAIPDPLVSNVVDIALLTRELLYYQDSFGIDKEALTMLAQDEHMTLQELSAHLHLEAFITTASGYVSKAIVRKGLERVAKYTLPGSNSITISAIMYPSTVLILNRMINDVAEDAKRVIAYVSNKLKGSYEGNKNDYL